MYLTLHPAQPLPHLKIGVPTPNPQAAVFWLLVLATRPSVGSLGRPPTRPPTLPFPLRLAPLRCMMHRDGRTQRDVTGWKGGRHGPSYAARTVGSNHPGC